MSEPAGAGDPSPRTSLATALWQAALLLLVGWLALWPSSAHAHEFKLDAVVVTHVRVEGASAQVLVRAPLYLYHDAKFPSRLTEIDVGASGPALERSLARLQQSVQLLQDGKVLAPQSASGRLSLPSDRSFDAFDSAVTHIAAPHEPDLAITIDQGYVDARIDYRLPSAGGVFALRTNIAPELGPALKVSVRYRADSGEERALLLKGGAGTLDLNPSRIAAAGSFVALGIAHILGGYDHLLFLVCLIIPLRGWRALLTVVTAFTVAHSLTLLGSAFGLTPRGEWFPPFVELVIALSIVYTALENIVGVDLRRRVLLSMLFGLVHGFGFSYALREDLQFAGGHLVTSLLAFNVGIEIGQIAVLALALPVLALVTRRVLPGRVGAIILSALLAHVGWHWMTDRWDAFALQRWPVPDLASVPLLLAWAGGLAIAAALAVNVVGRIAPAPAGGAAPGD